MKPFIWLFAYLIIIGAPFIYWMVKTGHIQPSGILFLIAGGVLIYSVFNIGRKE